jgi:hypothetical protein
MIVTFTDFGVTGPYLGELRIALERHAPGVPVVDLMSDAPRFDPRASAYLLAALARRLPADCVVVAVVDPGVGGGRQALVLRADERWYVGPDNGLLRIVAAQAGDGAWWRILWRPAQLSASFHGRDLFAPVAARLIGGEALSERCAQRISEPDHKWPPDLAEIVYLDGFGNAVSGLRAQWLDEAAVMRVAGVEIGHAATFSAVPVGRPFWYRNSMDLIEVAVNQGSAASALGLDVGSPLSLLR